mmetsp:Transcript_28987/g.62361  ORF Transcript_28987/g.62361 Transcript_28987/m.62361 type:complete len:246 (-) Transcript_28987:24-761(-)
MRETTSRSALEKDLERGLRREGEWSSVCALCAPAAPRALSWERRDESGLSCGLGGRRGSCAPRRLGSRVRGRRAARSIPSAVGLPWSGGGFLRSWRWPNARRAHSFSGSSSGCICNTLRSADSVGCPQTLALELPSLCLAMWKRATLPARATGSFALCVCMPATMASTPPDSTRRSATAESCLARWPSTEQTQRTTAALGSSDHKAITSAAGPPASLTALAPAWSCLARWSSAIAPSVMMPASIG